MPVARPEDGAVMAEIPLQLYLRVFRLLFAVPNDRLQIGRFVHYLATR